eukprot:TRINITY_DN28855_c0_g1_i1.p1 TRINITY_DN28855_c0_g1~~TRINITY_DN28855_c0_g1_i1.p1  ORF type:complete len:1392 (+),score=438.61 TRINITY_DN28855_c0_g1_i1:81-4178(+)
MAPGGTTEAAATLDRGVLPLRRIAAADGTGPEGWAADARRAVARFAACCVYAAAEAAGGGQRQAAQQLLALCEEWTSEHSAPIRQIWGEGEGEQLRRAIRANCFLSLGWAEAWATESVALQHAKVRLTKALQYPSTAVLAPPLDGLVDTPESVANRSSVALIWVQIRLGHASQALPLCSAAALRLERYRRPSLGHEGLLLLSVRALCAAANDCHASASRLPDRRSLERAGEMYGLAEQLTESPRVAQDWQQSAGAPHLDTPGYPATVAEVAEMLRELRRQVNQKLAEEQRGGGGSATHVTPPRGGVLSVKLPRLAESLLGALVARCCAWPRRSAAGPAARAAEGALDELCRAGAAAPDPPGSPVTPGVHRGSLEGPPESSTSSPSAPPAPLQRPGGGSVRVGSGRSAPPKGGARRLSPAAARPTAAGGAGKSAQPAAGGLRRPKSPNPAVSPNGAVGLSRLGSGSFSQSQRSAGLGASKRGPKSPGLLPEAHGRAGAGKGARRSVSANERPDAGDPEPGRAQPRMVSSQRAGRGGRPTGGKFAAGPAEGRGDARNRSRTDDPLSDSRRRTVSTSASTSNTFTRRRSGKGFAGRVATPPSEPSSNPASRQTSAGLSRFAQRPGCPVPLSASDVQEEGVLDMALIDHHQVPPPALDESGEDLVLQTTAPQLPFCDDDPDPDPDGPSGSPCKSRGSPGRSARSSVRGASPKVSGASPKASGKATPRRGTPAGSPKGSRCVTPLSPSRSRHATPPAAREPQQPLFTPSPASAGDPALSANGRTPQQPLFTPPIASDGEVHRRHRVSGQHASPAASPPPSQGPSPARDRRRASLPAAGQTPPSELVSALSPPGSARRRGSAPAGQSPFRRSSTAPPDPLEREAQDTLQSMRVGGGHSPPLPNCTDKRQFEEEPPEDEEEEESQGGEDSPHVGPAEGSRNLTVAVSPGSGMAFAALAEVLHRCAGWTTMVWSRQRLMEIAKVDLLLADKHQAEALTEAHLRVSLRMKRQRPATADLARKSSAEQGAMALTRREKPLVLNYFGGSRQMTLKTKMLKCLREHVRDPYEITPPTFIIVPRKDTGFSAQDERFDFQTVFSEYRRTPHPLAPRNTWIAKSSHGSKGDNMYISGSKEDICSFIDRQQEPYPWVVQLYIENPFLIQRRKFDIRAWVLMLPDGEVYFCRLGVCRTSSYEYNGVDKLEDIFVHLTNHHIQEQAPAYQEHEAGNELFWDKFHEYLQGLPQPLHFYDDVLPEMHRITALTINSAKRHLTKTFPPLCPFQLLGFDFLLDGDGRSWLLEVNGSPAIAEVLKEDMSADLAEVVFAHYGVDPETVEILRVRRGDRANSFERVEVRGGTSAGRRTQGRPSSMRASRR